MHHIPMQESNMHIEHALDLIVSIGQSLGKRDSGRYSMSVCNNNGNSSNMDQMCGSINKDQVFNHGVG